MKRQMISRGSQRIYAGIIMKGICGVSRMTSGGHIGGSFRMIPAKIVGFSACLHIGYYSELKVLSYLLTHDGYHRRTHLWNHLTLFPGIEEYMTTPDSFWMVT